MLPLSLHSVYAPFIIPWFNTRFSGARLDIYYFFEENFLQTHNLTEKQAEQGGGFSFFGLLDFGGDSSSKTTEEWMSRFNQYDYEPQLFWFYAYSLNRSIEETYILSTGSVGKPDNLESWYKGIEENPEPISFYFRPICNLFNKYYFPNDSDIATKAELAEEGAKSICRKLDGCVAAPPEDAPAWPHDPQRTNQANFNGMITSHYKYSDFY